MASPTRRTGPALVGVLLTTLLAGCSGFAPRATSKATSPPTPAPSVSGPTTTGATAKPPSPPAVGTCRSLSYADISRFSNASRTAPCRKPHTSYTFDVVQLADEIAFSGVRIENDAVQNAAAQACRTSFRRFIGGDSAARALSRLTVTYFVPRQPAFDRGAHWVRCDLVALQSASALAPLPRAVHGLLDSPDALARFGVCSKADPGLPAVGLVMCGQAHAFRAVAALRLGGGDAPYPGETVTRTDGQQRCHDLLDQLLGRGTGYTYSWTYPAPEDWRAGQRFGYCWQQTQS